MPLYEYACNQCGTLFEKMVRMSEASQKPACPHCGSTHTNKQLSKIAITSSGGAAASSSSGSSCSSGGSPFR